MNTKTLARYTALVARYVRIQSLLAGCASESIELESLISDFRSDADKIPESHLPITVNGFQLSELVRRY